jgi:paired amphipathic helix protein Sin3a
LSCKEEGRKQAHQKFQHLVANPIAVELGMDDSQGPSSVLEQILRDRGAGGEDNGEALYQYLLEACEKLFMSELDQATFEEHMRWFFGTKVGLERFPFLCRLSRLRFASKGVLALHRR